MLAEHHTCAFEASNLSGQNVDFKELYASNL